MVAMKLLTCLFFIATAHDVLPDDFDTVESLSLLQIRASPQSRAPKELVQKNSRCKGNGSRRAKFASAEACADAWAGQGMKYFAFWNKGNQNPAGIRGLCMAWREAQCPVGNIGNIARSNKNRLFQFVEELDEASATGDPHLTLTDGTKQDMCCDDGPCTPCDLSDVESLLQEDETRGVAKELVQKNSRCKGNGSRRAKFASADACAEAWAGQGMKYFAFWNKGNSNPAGIRGLCMAWREAQCPAGNIGNIARSNKNRLFQFVEELEEEQEDQASATGDPHLVIAGGEKADMCCEDGVCEACPPM